MKKILLVVAFAISITASAQDEKTVTLVVSGLGKTQDEARQVALRSAIEQAFGTFISSKTEILNDSLVKDEIVSVANGNIEKFVVVSDLKMPDNSYATTLNATVSLTKLTSFVQSKGGAIELKGNLFALNIKQQMLNEKGESKAICNIVSILHNLFQSSFDYEIESSDPTSSDGSNANWRIPIEVLVKPNNNFKSIEEYLTKNLTILGLNDVELAKYKSLNKNIFPVTINNRTYWLRNEVSVANLNYLLSNYETYLRLFIIDSGSDKIFGSQAFFRFKEIEKLLEIKNLESEGLVFNFLDTGVIASFSWIDTKTTTEIEKMTGYKIMPLGNTSTYQCDENNKIKDSNLIYGLLDSKVLRNDFQVSKTPYFKEGGGIAQIDYFLSKNYKVPVIAIEKGLGGKCFFDFEIRADGNIGKIIILRGFPDCPECDRELVRIINTMPKFEPALNLDGKPVSFWLNKTFSIQIR